jgi:hypothetical protein
MRQVNSLKKDEQVELDIGNNIYSKKALYNTTLYDSFTYQLK